MHLRILQCSRRFHRCPGEFRFHHACKGVDSNSDSDSDSGIGIVPSLVYIIVLNQIECRLEDFLLHFNQWRISAHTLVLDCLSAETSTHTYLGNVIPNSQVFISWCRKPNHWATSEILFPFSFRHQKGKCKKWPQSVTLHSPKEAARSTTLSRQINWMKTRFLRLTISYILKMENHLEWL